jgi:hypothetical protein
MNRRTEIYDLLLSYYEGTIEPLEEFHAAWYRGIGVTETARRLRVAPETLVHVSTHADPPPLGEVESGSRIVLIGESGDWTAVLGDYECTSTETMAELSRDGGAAISIGWHISGGERVKYFVNGELETSFNFLMPDLAEGGDPGALRNYMEGLRFDAGEVESVGESITSAFIMIGRVTGKQLDMEWLDATHMRAVIPPR